MTNVHVHKVSILILEINYVINVIRYVNIVYNIIFVYFVYKSTKDSLIMEFVIVRNPFLNKQEMQLV